MSGLDRVERARVTAGRGAYVARIAMSGKDPAPPTPSESESESATLIAATGWDGAQSQHEEQAREAPAALLHLALEGCYLVLVTAAVATVTPPQDEGVGESPIPGMMWLVPVAGGLLMGAAASAEVLGCCCEAPAQETVRYLLAVLGALALGVVDLISHVRALVFCSSHPEDSWCVGAPVDDGSMALDDGGSMPLVAEEQVSAPPEDSLVEWVDERAGSAVVWGRWVVAAAVAVLILARAAALANGWRSCRSPRSSVASGGLTRQNTGTPSVCLSVNPSYSPSPTRFSIQS
eukprot:COSAG03_NODE_2511_length_2686_cov_11.679938_1_plen_291_part_00